MCWASAPEWAAPFTAFSVNAYDINGTQINTTTNLQGLRLYLYNGDLEVVPEPGERGR